MISGEIITSGVGHEALSRTQGLLIYLYRFVGIIVICLAFEAGA